MEDAKPSAPAAAALEVDPIDKDGLLDEVTDDDRNVPTPLADINMTLDDSVDWVKSSEQEFGTEQHNPEISGLQGPSETPAVTGAPVATPNQQADSFLQKIGEARREKQSNPELTIHVASPGQDWKTVPKGKFT